jgi:hypothetical protein
MMTPLPLTDEIECGLRHLLPGMVEGDRVAAIRDLHDLRHPWVAPLRLPQVPSGLGMVVGIPCMANTDTKINKVYVNVITTLAACCG